MLSGAFGKSGNRNAFSDLLLLIVEVSVLRVIFILFIIFQMKCVFLCYFDQFHCFFTGIFSSTVTAIYYNTYHAYVQFDYVNTIMILKKGNNDLM